MAKQFQVGQRVRVFSHYGPWDGTVVETEYRCTNYMADKFAEISGMLMVQDEKGTNWVQHPRQCVRLKPKKPERIERWITVYTGENQSSGYAWLTPGTCRENSEHGTPQRLVHLVELRKGEKIIKITRENP